MVYIVKWIPKDLDVTIDHTTRYRTPLKPWNSLQCSAIEPKVDMD